MVLIDGVNAFYYKTQRMKDDQRNIVSPDKITLFEGFRQFFKSDWVHSPSPQLITTIHPDPKQLNLSQFELMSI